MVNLQELLREKELVELLMKLVQYRHQYGREELKQLILEINAVIEIKNTLQENPEKLIEK